MLLRKLIIGLGLLSCLAAIGCANGPLLRRGCCKRPHILNTTPIGRGAPAPCCNGNGVAVAPGGQIPTPAPSFSAPRGQVVIPNQPNGALVPNH